MVMVSIVIPVYNAEKYLNACVESIRSQTFHDWEALLVDDGSTDGSRGIALEYAQKDSRIKVFSNKQKGVSSARNLGVSMASGEYIMFVDSDDTVEPWACECLLSAVQNYDLAVSAYRTVYENGQSEVNHVNAFSGSVADLCKCIEEYIDGTILQAPWCKLFKKKIITENHILFPEHFSYGEDTYFVYNYMKHIETINIIATVTNNYFFREKSLSHRFRPDKYKIHVMLNGMICDICKQFGLREHTEKRDMLNRKAFAVFLSECASCENREMALSAVQEAVSMKETEEAFQSLEGLPLKRKVVGMLIRRKKYRLLIWFSRLHEMILSKKRGHSERKKVLLYRG